MEYPEADKEKIRTALAYLNLFRSAITIYREDHDGNPPASLDDLVPKYIRCVPVSEIPIKYSGQEGAADRGKTYIDSDLIWRGEKLSER